MTDSINHYAKQRTLHRTFLLAGLITISLGVLYYILFRPLPIGFSWLSIYPNPDWQSPSLITQLKQYDWYYSIPSFLHVMAFSCLSLAVVSCSKRNITITGISWFCISLIFEFSQKFILMGNFDNNDLLAALLGATCFVVVSMRFSLSPHIENQAINIKPTTFNPNPLYLAPLFVMGVLAITGSVVVCDDPRTSSESCVPTRQTQAEPIYMSYAELRSTAIFTTTSKPLLSTGKIYAYNDYLFINSPNVGIHIYDNRDPSIPVEIGFINIPGNVDIAIKQGYLYVDSYIDLVTIDINNIQTAVVANRKIDVFPYNPYQNIPDNIYFNNIDESKGVIVGYNIQ